MCISKYEMLYLSPFILLAWTALLPSFLSSTPIINSKWFLPLRWRLKHLLGCFTSWFEIALYLTEQHPLVSCKGWVPNFWFPLFLESCCLLCSIFNTVMFYYFCFGLMNDYWLVLNDPGSWLFCIKKKKVTDSALIKKFKLRTSQLCPPRLQQRVLVLPLEHSVVFSQKCCGGEEDLWQTLSCAFRGSALLLVLSVTHCFPPPSRTSGNLSFIWYFGYSCLHKT